MPRNNLVFTVASAAIASLSGLVPVSVHAQASQAGTPTPPQAVEKPYDWKASFAKYPVGKVPRTRDGKPDLQGIWSHSVLTPLERPAAARNKPEFSLAEAKEAEEYRDLGIKNGTNGDYVAHLIRHNGKKTKDEVQQWHVHDCTFQLVYVLNGWATFEYEGQGQRTIRTGDCILQTPGIKHREIACSDDFEVLKIVSPANFTTRVVEAPQAGMRASQ
jgi:quercetin dioxygenase-like cupin family protein